MRPAADVAGLARRERISLLRLPQDGEAAGEGRLSSATSSVSRRKVGGFPTRDLKSERV
jgi:hypothetical protein